MPTEFRIDKKTGIIFSRFWGDLTFEEIYEHREQILAHPDYTPELGQLADFSGAGRILVDPSDVRRLVSTEPERAGARRAFFAPDDLTFALLRLYEMSLGGHRDELAVFRTEHEARIWLGLGEKES